MAKSTINQLYQQYQIMPNLQQHQLRVAAVAQTICQNLTGVEVSEPEVIAACLLHDMGNIIKFDLNLFPEFCQPAGVEYWQGVKQEFIDKYGPNEHQASVAIARQIGVSAQTLSYINAISFSRATANVTTTDYGQKICAYSDMRVGPYGINSLAERFADLSQRYQRKYAGSEHQDRRKVFEDGIRTIETQLQAKCQIELHQITDQSVNDTIENLKSWSL
jgi:hypothetical protein